METYTRQGRRGEGKISELVEERKGKKICSACMQNRHFRQLETFLHLSLDGGQFREEAGASEELNELQQLS